jgi:hypothetical protein
MLNRGLAAIARTSLRDPYTTEVPNLWPRVQISAPRLTRDTWRRTRLRRRAAAVTATLMVAVATTALLPAASPATPTAAHRTDAVLDTLVPPSAGPLVMLRENTLESAFHRPGADALVSSGRVYTIHNGDIIEGSVQVSLLQNGVQRDSAELLSGMEQSIGGGTFVPMRERVPLFDGACACSGQFRDVRVADEPLRFHQRLYVSVLPDQRIYLWFPPQSQTMAIVVLRGQFPQLSADELVLTLSDHQHGAPLVAVPVPQDTSK